MSEFNLLLELVARYIYDRKTWYTFDAAGPQFNKVCNKLVDNLEKDFSYIKRRKFWENNRFWYESTTYYKDMKHGLEILDISKKYSQPLYCCNYKYGKKHGLEREIEMDCRNMLVYRCNWVNGKKYGNEIYFENDIPIHQINWRKGLKHGSEIKYDEDGNMIEELIWIKGELVKND